MAATATDTQPSFYYMLIARSCFQRSRIVANRARSQALSEAGRDYLAKAMPGVASPGDRHEAA